jgi:hypothetical protein
LCYKVTMNTAKHHLAIVELLLVFPATLFMAALFMRNIQPAPYQPAETARWIVNWFSARPHIGLAVYLIALPFLAFLIGLSTVIRTWRNDAELRRATLMVVEAARTHLSILAITTATLTAGGILAIVALHMITD